MLYDFHTHSFLSDGELLPMELIRRCVANGYTALAITDHASESTAERIIREVRSDAELVTKHWGIQVLTGIELTHVPAAGTAEAAEHARSAGAQIVVVHGETVTEPVEPGTNRAAILSGKVDILAHPGLIAPEDARLAAERGVFLEISCRKGHSLTNGWVVRVGREAGVRFLVNTDGHAPGDLLTPEFAVTVARGAGLTDAEIDQVLYENPKALLAECGMRNAESRTRAERG